MAIRLWISTKGGRAYHGSEHAITAYEIRHVVLPAGYVGLNISGANGKVSAGIRMEVDEARILADMLIEGADIAERRHPATPGSE